MFSAKLRNLLYSEALNYNDIDVYVSDLALSSIWGDGEMDPIPEERIDLLRRIWKRLHATIPSLVKASSLSQTAFAAAFGIPLRTLQHWMAEDRDVPPYLIWALAEILQNNGIEL